MQIDEIRLSGTSMTTAHVELPTHLSLREMSDLCELGIKTLIGRAQAEQWPQHSKGALNADDNMLAESAHFAVEALPKEIQLSVKQAYLKQHSPHSFKRVSELAAEQLHRLLALEKLFNRLTQQLNALQISVDCIDDSSAYERLFREVGRFMRQQNVYLFANDFAMQRTSTTQFLQWYRQYLAEGLKGLLKYCIDGPVLSARRQANIVKRRLLRLYLFNSDVTAQQAVHYLQELLGQDEPYDVDAIENTLSTWREKQTSLPCARQHAWEVAIYPEPVAGGKTLVTLLNGAMRTQLSVVCHDVSPCIFAALLRQALMVWPASGIVYADSGMVPFTVQLVDKLNVLGIEVKHSPFEAELFAQRWPLTLLNEQSTYVFDDFSQSPWLFNHYWQDFSAVGLVDAGFARLFDFLLPEAGENQGFAVVESEGVYLNGVCFHMANLCVYEGYCVFCRQDPVDSSKVLMFSSMSRQYLGELHRG